MTLDLNDLSHEELAAQLATMVRLRPQVEGSQRYDGILKAGVGHDGATLA
jgi:hypothetical protein